MLRTFIDDKRQSSHRWGPTWCRLFDIGREYVAGGKRLRPAFAYWGWRAAGGTEQAHADA